MFTIFFILAGRYGGKTNDHKEEVAKAIEFLPIFQNDPHRLYKEDAYGNIHYHGFVDGFLEFVRSSSLNDPEYIKHLEQYRPKPFEKIKTMDYTGLRAVLTMITKGESMSGRKDYLRQVIQKGYIVQILQRLRDIAL